MIGGRSSFRPKVMCIAARCNQSLTVFRGQRVEIALPPTHVTLQGRKRRYGCVPLVFRRRSDRNPNGATQGVVHRGVHTRVVVLLRRQAPAKDFWMCFSNQNTRKSSSCRDQDRHP